MIDVSGEINVSNAPLDLTLSTFWLEFISYERGSGEVVSFFSSRSKSSRSHSFGVTSSWRVNAYGVTSSSRKLFFYYSFILRVLNTL